jgi:hypothetical protein
MQARREGRSLIAEIIEEEAAARSPTTGAEGDASNLSTLWIGRRSRGLLQEQPAERREDLH